MQHNSLKTYMRKGGFRASSRPSLPRSKKSGLAVIQKRTATLHYNCLPRAVNILASWVVPDGMAEDCFGGGVVLGWETEAYGDGKPGAPQDRKPGNDYPVAVSVRCQGEQWVLFKLEEKGAVPRLDVFGLMSSLTGAVPGNKKKRNKN